MTVSRVAFPPLPADLEYCVVARTNDSLGRRTRWLVFGALAVTSMTLALAFVVAGAWVVLPYSALEIVALGCAFAWFEWHAGDCQRLAVTGDRVVVDETSGRVRQRREFNRYWLRVEVEPVGNGAAPRLFLRGGGASCQFGHALPGPERLAIARELRRYTGMR